MISIKNLSYSYGKNLVLRSIDLELNEGEILCLLGESGSGKTTLLRLIAGLETDYQGDIRLDRKSLKNIPVHQRGFGFMFQDFALFPHMNIEENVTFGLKMQGKNAAEQKRIVAEMLDLLGMSGYEKRHIDAISGGQKQRVALARSLAPKPRLLMLDEPLGSLDASLRERLLLELREIIKQLGITAIYVTHDQQEAYAVADRIAIMHMGRIIQIDNPETLYHQPKSLFVVNFLGLSNLVPTELLPDNLKSSPASHYLLHPAGLELDEKGQLEGKIIERVFQGENTRLRVQIGKDTELSFHLSSSAKIPQINEKVHLSIVPSYVLPMSNS